jgi:hypothetical protein
MLRCGAKVAEPSLQVKEIFPTSCMLQVGWWAAVVAAESSFEGLMAFR